MSEASTRAVSPRRITMPALAALILGFGLGVLARQPGAAWLLGFASVAKPLGMLWTNALQMIVLPLIVSNLVLALVSVGDGRRAGKLGALSLISFLTMLGFAALVGMTLTPAMLSIFPIDPAARLAFRAFSAESVTTAADAAKVPALSDWLVTLIPVNPLKAVLDENLLGVVICVVLFSLAMTRIHPDRRAMLTGFFQAIADATGVLVGWLISVLPIAAFALAFGLGAEAGLSVAGTLGYFILASSVALLALTLLLYPLAVWLGRVPLMRFASALAPAQAVAAGTRSSLASLPAMMESAERLGMRKEVSGFVLPLAVSTFKLSLALSQPLKLLFLTSMFGIQSSPEFLVSFTAAMILLSFTTAGIPSGGTFVSIPLFIAAGIPVEAVVLLKVADAIPDIFKTVLNVTADITVATIVARFAGAPALERQPAPGLAGSEVPAAS